MLCVESIQAWRPWQAAASLTAAWLAGAWLVAAAVAAVSPLPAAASPAAVAQAKRSLQPTSSLADTLRIEEERARKSARDAQRAFESTRRRHLPFWNGPTGPCDEIVGRFCLWHEDDPTWNPGPEARSVTAAREKLVLSLESLVLAAPGDAWVVGQWVRYLVEAGRREEAETAARSCRAEKWWCAALLAYALHAEAEFSAAEAAFERALRAMPVGERCSWTELSYLLEGDLRSDYEDLSCAEREPLERRIWWLADPLLMVPGNERRSEHFSRRVLNRLQVGADSPYGVRWGVDLEELLLRYGWPIGWSRRRQPVYSPARQRPSITGHDPDESFHFLPASELVAGFTALDPAWDLSPRRPREEYRPPYARAFDGPGEGFDHQLAVFRRAAAALLVGAYAWSTDSLPAGTPVRTSLVWASETGESRIATSRGSRRGVLTLEVPARAGILGLEALADSAGRAARVRFGRRLDPPAGASLSDLLLVEASEDRPAPESLEEALERVRPSTTVEAGQLIGLLWELYDVPPGTPLQVEVSLTSPRKGFFRRAAEWLGLARREGRTVSLGWRERPAGGSRPESRYVELRVPDLKEGRYVVSAAVRLAGGRELTTARIVEVERR